MSVSGVQEFCLTGDPYPESCARPLGVGGDAESSCVVDERRAEAGLLGLPPALLSAAPPDDCGCHSEG